MDPALLPETKSTMDMMYLGIKYLLDRLQEDPDVMWYCGPGTETFRRLCMAEAAYLGCPLKEVEKARMVDLQPSYRKREPEVIELRKRLEALS